MTILGTAVTLQLTEQEAKTLLTICNKVAGSPRDSARRQIDSARRKLLKAMPGCSGKNFAPAVGTISILGPINLRGFDMRYPSDEEQRALERRHGHYWGTEE